MLDQAVANQSSPEDDEPETTKPPMPRDSSFVNTAAHDESSSTDVKQDLELSTRSPTNDVRDGTNSEQNDGDTLA